MTENILKENIGAFFSEDISLIINPNALEKVIKQYNATVKESAESIMKNYPRREDEYFTNELNFKQKVYELNEKINAAYK